MGTITARKAKSGVARYTAQIRIRRDGVIVHSEARTFPRRAMATAWIKQREVELAAPGALEMASHRGVTVEHLVGRYLEDLEHGRGAGRSKIGGLKVLRESGLGQALAVEIRPEQIMAHVRERRASGTGPATVLQDMIWLRVVLRHARRAWGMPIPLEVVEDAIAAASAARLIGRPRRRERRPTGDELRSLDRYFAERCRSEIPMRLVMWLAIYSTRRIDELFRLRRADLDRAKGGGLLRDVKHPDGSAGNHRWFTLPDRGWHVVDEILRTVPDVDGRLLPFNAKSAGTVFTRATRILGIEDLRFHDLRHEGASRLAEDGYTIPQLQAVTLHESWGSLQRYVQIRPAGDMAEF